MISEGFRNPAHESPNKNYQKTNDQQNKKVVGHGDKAHERKQLKHAIFAIKKAMTSPLKLFSRQTNS